MEVLSSRILLRPSDLERSLAFYSQTLGLHVYREWDGDERGVVFFLGGGFLEVSGRNRDRAGEKLEVWLQVRDVDQVHAQLAASEADVVEPPAVKPWGLKEMRIVDPDGVKLVIVQVPEDHPLRRREA